MMKFIVIYLTQMILLWFIWIYCKRMIIWQNIKI